MAYIITVFNHKGGTGKSTVSLLLSAAFERSASIALIDADPQKSLTSLTEIIDGFSLPLVEVETVTDIVARPERLIIVDMPPYIVDDTPAILEASTLIILPCLASLPAVAATVKTYQYIQDQTDTKAVALLNMVKGRQTLSTDMRNALTGQNIPLLRSELSQRAAYDKALSYGKSIYKLNDNKAISELDKLAQEILTYLL